MAPENRCAVRRGGFADPKASVAHDASQPASREEMTSDLPVPALPAPPAGFEPAAHGLGNRASRCERVTFGRASRVASRLTCGDIRRSSVDIGGEWLSTNGTETGPGPVDGTQTGPRKFRSWDSIAWAAQG